MVEHKFKWKNDGRLKIMIGCGTRPEITKGGSVNSTEALLLEEFRKLSKEKQDAVIQNVKWLGE